MTKKSIGGGQEESNRLMHDATMQSTFYSQNNSVESPREVGATVTPMTSKINYTSSDTMQSPDQLRNSPSNGESMARLTKTPTQVKGVNAMQMKKFKKAKLANSALKDMVVIYADMGGKHLRQQAIA